MYGPAEHIVQFLAAHPGVVTIGFLTSTVWIVRYLFSSKPQPGSNVNPFSVDTSRQPKPLETDPKARDKVLKQGFVEKRIPENLDAIIIGSGIGGLTTAAVLAKAGKKVLVLEQHDQAGGCCHTFVEKGFEFDVGIHYIGEMRNNTVARLLVEQITEGQLQWVNMMDEFDMVALGEPGKQKFIPFTSGGREAWKKGMLKYFPDEEKALDRFLNMLKEVRENLPYLTALKIMPKFLSRLLINTGLVHVMTKYFKYSNRTVDEVMRELTDNEELRAVLSYCWGDYGTSPRQGSFAMHATIINHYLHGAAYPRGGSSEIAFHIIPIIEQAGGKVLVRAPVTQILTNSEGRAIGVRVHKSGGDVDIHAKRVISDAGVINTLTALLPQEIACKSSIYQYINKKLESGTGAVTLYVGLSGTAEELGIKSQNHWAYTGTDLQAISEDYLNSTAEEVMDKDIPLLFISFPSSKDPTYNERFPGKTACTVLTLGNWKWFSEWEKDRVMKRGEDYQTLKMAIGRRMWNQVCAIYPQLEDKVEYFDVGSPVTNKYYIAAPKGEIYGLDHTVDRFGSPEIMMNLRPETDIPGLYLTGQDVWCCGFMGAMMGGLLAASKVLKRNLWKDLSDLRKQIGKKEESQKKEA